VEGGWNQVGPFEAEIGPGAVKQNPSGILEEGTWFRWAPAQNRYIKPSALKPGFGYWVFATGSGTLDLSGGDSQATAAAATASAQSRAQTADVSSAQKAPQGALTLRVTDQGGHGRKLYIASELTEAQRRKWRVPPVGPGNTFAVRFGNGLRAAEASSSEEESEARGESPSAEALLRIRGSEGPVTLRLQAPRNKAPERDQGGRSVRVRDVATGGELLDARLTTEEPTAQVPAGANRLRLSVESVPAEAALGKPYPNPARGQATIEYAVPEQREVTIKVYDVLGREVSTVAEGAKQAGRHSVRLRARQLSSGTYFVRMRAGDFRETRRVAVVR